MAAISCAFSVGQVARRLGVKEKLLREIAICMDPEDGCLWIHDTNREILAFTEYGIENLETILEDDHGWNPADHPNRRPYGTRA